MADTKISAATAVTTPVGTDEYATNQGGVAKKTTLAQIRQSLGTVPTIASVGAEFTSTGTPTATLPGTHAANDILLLILQTSNEDQGTISGYTQLGPANGIGNAATAGSTKLTIYWKRDNGSEVAPTLVDSGDHTYGVMIAVRGCATTGDPFRMVGQAWKLTGSTTGTADSGKVRVPNSLVMNIFAHALDQAGAAGSSPTNANLTSVTEQFDDSTTDGTGGGLYVMTGIKATAGDLAGSTVTWSGSTVDLSTTIYFPPADAFPIGRETETYTYIGSNANLADTWIRQSNAVKVFVQLVDGGGSGSGGNTTTTAAGGGGGGGGGYDEAWYEAEDFTGGGCFVKAGKGGNVGTALNQAGNAGVLSEFDQGGVGPLTALRRIAGTVATAAASADGGNGGCGSGAGTTSPTVQATRLDAWGTNAARPAQNQGAGGGSGTTAPTGGGNADWGGGGGESGGDTDAAITAINNGWSMRGGGGGSSGRTNTTISQPGHGGGANATFAAQGATGAPSTRLPFGGAGGVGGGSSVVTGGKGGFPGGGGGGGAGVAGGFGGAGGDGVVMVTTFF